MAPSGKHIAASPQITVGKHGVVVQSQRPTWHITLALLLAAAIALVPIAITLSRAQLDTQAFADSTRSTFSDLCDTQSRAEPPSMPKTSADYTNHIGTKMQNSFMSGGCEIVSLGIALESMGIDVDFKNLVDSHLNIDGHFSNGYSGNPYSRGAGYAPGIAAAANSYLESKGLDVRAHNLSNASFSQLETLVAFGYPVLVWTTMGLADPQFTGLYDGDSEWYSNEHCVVLYGFEGTDALISDPLEGFVKREVFRFANIYEQCGSMAIAIY